MRDKKKILGVDFACTVICRQKFEDKPYTPDMIDRMMMQAAEAGFTTIYWRVGEIGRVTYHSKVRTPACAELEIDLHQYGGNQDSVFGSPESRGRAALNELMARCDPPELAVTSAHKHGLEIVIYTTLFDESIPGLEAEFNFRHPEFCWRHRHFEHHCNPGLLSYGYPEVREYKLAEVKELLAFGADGIYLDCARSHAGIWPLIALPYGSDVWANYGFNDVECSEFEQRYGRSPRLENLANAAIEDFDWEAWQKLRGEYLTMFIRQAGIEAKKNGQTLSVGFYTDAENYLSPAGHRARPTLGGLHIDWETWAAEGLIDEVVLATEHRRLGDYDWLTHSQKQFASAQAAGLRVCVSVSVEHRFDELGGEILQPAISVKDQPALFFEILRGGIRNILNSSADGVYCYEHARVDEAADFMGVAYWKELKRAFTC